MKGEAEQSVQALVDALSVTLRRPVLLDDPSLVPLAHSRQWGEIDGVRSVSILRRGVPAAVREALMAQGIAGTSEIVRTAADPALGMDERVCVPVRATGRLLGYLWLLDPERTLGDEDLDRARAAARRAALVLSDVREQSARDERVLLGRLVSPAQATRDAAVAEVQERGVVVDTSVVLCIVVATSEDVEPTAVALRAVRRLSVNCAIAGSFVGGAALLASLDDPVVRTMQPDQLAEWLYSVAPAGVAVGQSGPVGLAQLPDAVRHARIAVRVAQARPQASRFAAWMSLGADRLLAQLPSGWRDDLPVALVRLVDERGDLAATLAAFLETGGDVKATAEASALHRSGVYYRLRRVEELTGLDLASGEDRLLAHLAIRAERCSERSAE